MPYFFSVLFTIQTKLCPSINTELFLYIAWYHVTILNLTLTKPWLFSNSHNEWEHYCRFHLTPVQVILVDCWRRNRDGCLFWDYLIERSIIQLMNAESISELTSVITDFPSYFYAHEKVRRLMRVVLILHRQYSESINKACSQPYDNWICARLHFVVQMRL